MALFKRPRHAGAGARTVGEDAWPVFYARLVEADRDLARAASLDDEDPTPHAESISVALGLQLGPAEKQQRSRHGPDGSPGAVAQPAQQVG